MYCIEQSVGRESGFDLVLQVCPKALDILKEPALPGKNLFLWVAPTLKVCFATPHRTKTNTGELVE